MQKQQEQASLPSNLFGFKRQVEAPRRQEASKEYFEVHYETCSGRFVSAQFYYTSGPLIEIYLPGCPRTLELDISILKAEFKRQNPECKSFRVLLGAKKFALSYSDVRKMLEYLEQRKTRL